jgi:hypothetical protein
MTRASTQLLTLASRLGVIGGSLGILAGIAQATIGSRIPEWSGNKDQPVALGLLTVALSASAPAAARTLHVSDAPRDSSLARVTVWHAVVAAVCSSTVGRLWVIPGVLLIAAAGATFAACGWDQFRSQVSNHWLRGLLGILGVFELLMAVSAAPAITIAAGVLAGAALIVAAALATHGRRLIVSGLVAATLPFAILTWWAIIPPLLSAVAFAIGIAATRTPATPSAMRDVALPNLHPVS